MARLPKCDCLNWCGDDIRVPNGKAKPCQHWLREQAEAEERMNMEDDAARYRWLRKNSGYTIRCDLFGEVGPHEHKDGDLDALIDAQMAPNSNSTTPPVRE